MSWLEGNLFLIFHGGASVGMHHNGTNSIAASWVLMQKHSLTGCGGEAAATLRISPSFPFYFCCLLFFPPCFNIYSRCCFRSFAAARLVLLI